MKLVSCLVLAALILVSAWWWLPQAMLVPGRTISVCDLGRVGSALNGKRVLLTATLTVNRLGGELRDRRCPSTVVGFADDGDAQPDDLYWRFASSFDRPLLTVGEAVERVKIEGIVEAPGRAGAGRQYRSVVKLKKVIDFKVITQASPTN
jgi:hypothetical protein